nr:hypothetical protein [Tanacetum cinerariifolium]
FEDPDFLDKIYKVEKALYGLNQAPRAWYETLSTYVLDNGFQKGKIDKTLFIKRYKGGILLVQVYVDDIIFGSTKKELCNAFERFTEVKTPSTAMETQKPLLKDEDGEEVDVHMYRSMIGSLMYLTSSRPDIMFAVFSYARYQVNPKVSHLHAVKMIFSDYAGASLDKKSKTGGCQFLGCRLISWQCKKQTVVVDSTTKAEYVAASSCCENVLWIQNQQVDYGVTPLFQTMVIQNQSELGEGSAMPTDPYHTPIILQPSSSQSQKIQKPRKPKRKDTHVPQPSGPTESVANEVVHKELGDSLVRAATIASSLEAKQDSGNINKTQSKATPNESSSQGTNSGGGHRVLDLKKTKTSQRNEIDSLKRRVKKLEKRNRSRTHKLKRLYKVGLTARVESSRDEESLGEDASKQGRRIDVVDADDEITLVNDVDHEMFDVDNLGGEEVFVAEQEVVTIATTKTISTKEISLAQALEALKTLKPKVKGIFFKIQIDVDHQLAEILQGQEQAELSDAEKATLFQQLLEKRRKHFAAKRAEEKRNKPPTQAQKRKIMVNTFKDIGTKLVKGKEKRAGEELIQESTKKQKVDDDKEKAELK